MKEATEGEATGRWAQEERDLGVLRDGLIAAKWGRPDGLATLMGNVCREVDLENLAVAIRHLDEHCDAFDGLEDDPRVAPMLAVVARLLGTRARGDVDEPDNPQGHRTTVTLPVAFDVNAWLASLDRKFATERNGGDLLRACCAQRFFVKSAADAAEAERRADLDAVRVLELAAEFVTERAFFEWGPDEPEPRGWWEFNFDRTICNSSW
jgi:hypothetical protein